MSDETDSLQWQTLLTAPLLRAAYRAGSELAWRRSDAVRVLDFLTHQNYVVIGVDIWIPSEGGPIIPTPFVYDWSLGQPSRDPERMGSARDFIQGFDWDPSDAASRDHEPFFNLVVERADDVGL